MKWRASRCACITLLVINSVVISPSPMVNRSSPGCAAARPRSASGPTSSNLPSRALDNVAVAAAQAIARSWLAGESSTWAAISTARRGSPEFIAKVATRASIVATAAGSETRSRIAYRKSTAASGWSSIQNWLAAFGSVHAVRSHSERLSGSTGVSTWSASGPLPSQDSACANGSLAVKPPERSRALCARRSPSNRSPSRIASQDEVTTSSTGGGVSLSIANAASLNLALMCSIGFDDSCATSWVRNRRVAIWPSDARTCSA